MNTTLLLALTGFGSGILLGFASRYGRFCTLGALEDIAYGGRFYRALMWVSAIGASLIMMGILISQGWFQLESALFLRFAPNFPAHILGGLLFGYGMALAGMCGFTALARLGTGDLRALFVVIMIGISAFATSTGILAPLRLLGFTYSPLEPGAKLPSFAALAPNPATAFIVIGILATALPLLRKNYRRSRYPLWAIIMATGIIAGWLGTSWAARNSFEPVMVQSHTFSLPLGEWILFFMRSSVREFSFGLGSVAGVVAGSLIASLIKREIHWEACDDPRELRRQLIGAIFMGIGAVLAFGCSIGQGLSAMAVLSYGAPVTLTAIIIGAFIGLKQLIEG